MFFLQELKAFLLGCKEYWCNKQSEIERKFLELEEANCNNIQEPKKKRRKRSNKENKLPLATKHKNLATFAAELQIEIFTKLINWFNSAMIS